MLNIVNILHRPKRINTMGLTKSLFYVPQLKRKTNNLINCDYLNANYSVKHVIEAKLKKYSEIKIEEIKRNDDYFLYSDDVATFRENALVIDNYDFYAHVNRLYYSMPVPEHNTELILCDVDELNREFLGYINVEYHLSDDQCYLVAII